MADPLHLRPVHLASRGCRCVDRRRGRSTSRPRLTDPNGAESRSGVADSLMATLGDAMMRPIKDPSLPEAKVPTIMTAPGDQIKNAKWITFWSELDTEAKGLRGEAIQRFALGMDLPMERILGMSANMGSGGGRSNGVSHWGAWQIDEDTIKMHIEPMLDVVCAALTKISYLRPVSGRRELRQRSSATTPPTLRLRARAAPRSRSSCTTKPGPGLRRCR